MGILESIDKSSIPSSDKIKKKPFISCQGMYCDYQKFFNQDDNTDLTNIYVCQ